MEFVITSFSVILSDDSRDRLIYNDQCKVSLKCNFVVFAAMQLFAIAKYFKSFIATLRYRKLTNKQTNVIAELFIALFGQKFFFTSKCRKLRKSTLVNFFLVCFNINYLLFHSTVRVMSYVFYFVDNYFDVCLSGTTTTVQRYRSSSSLC